MARTCDPGLFAQGATDDYYANFDNNGYPTRNSVGAAEYKQFLDLYLLPIDPGTGQTETWVVTWTGPAGTFQVQVSTGIAGIAQSTTNPTGAGNRIEYTFSSSTLPINTTFQCTIHLQNVWDGTNYVQNVKIFRKTQEALLNSGEIFNPEFLALYGKNAGGGRPWGSYRFMQWQATINSFNGQWESRTQPSMFSLYGYNLNRPTYTGKVTPSGNNYVGAFARSGNPSAWTDKMMIQQFWNGAPSYTSVSGFTNGAPGSTSVQATAHGLTTGDKVFFAPGTMNGTGGSFPAWASGTTYNLGAVVTGSDGSIYRSMQTSNVGHDPSSDFGTNWRYVDNHLYNILGYSCDIGFWSVTVTDANNFILTNCDSRNWPVYTGSGGIVCKQITVSAGSLPAKPLVSQDGGMLYVPSIASIIGGAPALVSVIYDAVFDCLMLINLGSSQVNPVVGMPIETLVAFANKANTHPWFCIPAYATDDYVTQLATYVRDNLNAGLIARFELSNEVWNGGYTETGYASLQAALKWGQHIVPQGNAYCYNAWFGWRFYGVMSIISTVFAGQLSRVHRIMGCFTVPDQIPRQQQNRFKALSGQGLPANPISVADQLAIAPYIEGDRTSTATTQMVWNYVYGTPANQATALAWLDTKMRTNTNPTFTIPYCIATLFPSWAACAADPLGDGTAPAVGLTCYEGGPGLIPIVNNASGNPNDGTLIGANPINGVTITYNDIFAYFTGFYQSPYMAGIVRDYVNAAVAAGIVYPSQYTLIGLWGTGGMFGLIAPNDFGHQWSSLSELQLFNYRGTAP